MRAGVIGLLALALAQPALAQQPQPPRAPTLAELQGITEGLNAQLNSMRTLHVQAAAKVGELAAQNSANAEVIAALKEQLATAQAAVKALEAKAPKPDAEEKKP